MNVEQSISNIIDGIKLQKDLSILTYTERWIEPNLIARIIPDHFEQIISNILNNAIEELSLKNDRKIIISASKEGSFVKVAIKDNGAGISPENIEKIFKVQFSTKSSSNSFHYGTGLGLSFCQRMIQNYGGDITVKTQLNKGTEFVCLFPEYVSQTKSLCEV